MVWFARVSFLVVFALFWGGLTFYTGFVVRVSHDVLNDPMDGGLITQRVTSILQQLGVIAIAFMTCHALVIVRRCKWLGYGLVAISLILLVTQCGLFTVHGHLDDVIDAAAYEITDRDAFAIGHRRYNQLTTVQWLSSLLYLIVIVKAWHRYDASVTPD